MLARYVPSGIVDGRFYVWAPVVLLGAAAVGVIYQLLIHYIPHLVVVLVVFYGTTVIAGAVVASLFQSTHCRNPVFGAWLGGVGGLLTIAAGHWIEFRLNVSGGTGFLEYIQLRAREGWSVNMFGGLSRGEPTGSGTLTYLVWGLEAVGMIWSVAAGGRMMAGDPYCEKCGQWAGQILLKVAADDVSSQAVAAVREAKVVGDLIPGSGQGATAATGVGVPGGGETPGAASTLTYTVTSCLECKAFHLVRIDHEVTSTDGKRRQIKFEQLHDLVLLPSQEVAKLASLKQGGSKDQAITLSNG